MRPRRYLPCGGAVGEGEISAGDRGSSWRARRVCGRSQDRHRLLTAIRISMPTVVIEKPRPRPEMRPRLRLPLLSRGARGARAQGALCSLLALRSSERASEWHARLRWQFATRSASASLEARAGVQMSVLSVARAGARRHERRGRAPRVGQLEPGEQAAPPAALAHSLRFSRGLLHQGRGLQLSRARKHRRLVGRLPFSAARARRGGCARNRTM